MREIKILHMADLHLGITVTQFDAEKNFIRTKELETCALSAVRRGREYDFVLLSGDVFDSPDCSDYLADSFLNAVDSCPDTLFFMACGNHDPHRSRVIDYCRNNAPRNLHIFGSDAIEYHTFESKKLKICGVSFSGCHQAQSLCDSLEDADPSYTNIFCVHGEITTGSSLYNPIRIADIADKGYDYLALGHVHTCQGIRRLGSLNYCYPGIPEPSGFDECGEKGCVSIRVSDGGTEFEFVPLCKRRYIDETIDISDFEDYSSLIDVMKAMADGPDNVCRFTLVGNNRISSSLNTLLLEGQVDAFSVSVTDASTGYIDFEEYADDYTLRGICVSEALRLISKSAGEECEKYRKACRLLMDLFDGRGDDSDC